MGALINVVLPVFGIILTGYLAGRFKALGSDSAAAINRFVFYFALPAALFSITARAPIDRIFNWPFIGAYVSGVLLTVLISVIAGRFWFHHRDAATLSIVGLTAGWGNVGYMGLPLLVTAYGPDGALPTIVSIVSSILLFVGSAVAVLEGTRASGGSPLRVASHLAGLLLRNPLLIAPLFGIAFSMASLPLPKAVSNYLDLMAAAVAPAALFAMGLSLVGHKLIGNVGEVIWLATLKTVISPVLTFALVADIFLMEPLWSQAAVILSAMPAATNTYIIAQQYNVYSKTVSPAVVVSTAMSVITISFLLIWFGVG
ncbi:MAG TPA: AEC family transporter [Bradyrhizobium sp.]|nr:AEC family transporter [Bradyrhizobium sp.]